MMAESGNGGPAMIKENQRIINQLNVLSDGVLVLASMLAAHAVRFRIFSGIDSMEAFCYLWLGLAAALLCTMTYLLYGLYESHRFISFYKEAARLLSANLLNTLILLASLYVFHLSDFSRWILVIFFCCSSAVLLLKRGLVRMLLRRLRQRGLNQKHIILVGCGPSAQYYLDKISLNPEFGFKVDGYVSNQNSLPSLQWLGPYQELEAVLDARTPDEVVIAIPACDEGFLPQLTTACEKTGIRLSLIPGYADLISSNPRVDTLDGLPVINLRHIPLDNIGNAFLKRLCDIGGAALMLIPALPVMLIAFAGVKLSSPGPAIFKQERVGKDRRRFYIYKFRSMYVNDRADTAWSIEKDERQTRFGAWMRKHSVDELPQLFNVLKGDMSLVGPRPEIPFFVERFREQVPRYMVKHQVRPGMTGWAQVNGLRGDTSIRRRIEHDLFYIENWNILLDLKILLKTIFHLSSEQ